MNLNLLNKLRLSPKKRKEPFLSFKQILGFSPRNIELYNTAVRHSSVPYKNEKGELINNERLEFLGDAVLNTIISDILYRRYGNEREGFLTNARSNIVKRDSLNKISRQIGLDKLVIIDKKIDLSKNSNIYGNVLEAFIGAVYLDVGYDRCIQFVKERLLVSFEIMKMLAEDNENHKSELLEWCQQRYLKLDFQVIEETVDNFNQHRFVSQVIIQGLPICTGVGSSKKESHQQASFYALEIIRNDKNFLKTLADKVPDNS